MGAALSVWENDVEIATQKFKLLDCCTVYQAELLALMKATQRLQKGNQLTWGIYSDSRSALETVTNGTSLHPLAVDIRTNIRKARENQNIVNLFWIKAHAGLVGNERADELAKNAALKMKTRPCYDRCPISFVKQEIRQESLHEWNRRYQEGETAATTKIFFPSAITAYPIIKRIDLDMIMVQVITGHGGFSEYLNRFKCKESPACLCDPEMKESSLHVVIDCPMYIRERYEVEMEMGMQIKIDTVSRAIGQNNTRNLFIKFCKTVSKRVINRNK